MTSDRFKIERANDIDLKVHAKADVKELLSSVSLLLQRVN